MNFSIKKFDYSSIIIEIDKNNYRDNIADLWLERFLAEIDYFKINHKRSQFIVFDRIQKWDIEDNKLLYEKVGSLNDTQLKEQVDFNFSLEKKEYIFIQYFKYEGQNIEFGKNQIEKAINNLKKINETNCKTSIDKIIKFNNKIKLLSEYDKNEIVDDYIQSKLRSLENIKLFNCNNINYEIFENKKLQKYNLYFISILLSLFLTLAFLFLKTIFNVKENK